MSAVAGNILFQNTQIICPLGMDAVQILPLNKDEPHVYHC